MLPPLCVDSTLAGAFSACNPITTKAPAAIAVKGAPSVLFDPTDEQTEKLVAHLVKVWPPEGTRQDTHMSLAGALACMGYSEMWVKLVIQAITLATGNNDRKATERAQMVKATFEKLKEDKPIKAWGKFCDTVGEQNAAPILTLLGQKDFLTVLPERFPPVATKLPFVTGCWGKDPGPVNYLVDGFFVTGTVNLIVGAPDSFKTWAAFNCAQCVAMGLPWLGAPTVQGPVLVIDYEQSEHESKRRSWRMAPDRNSDFLHYSFAPGSLLDEKLWTKIADHIKEFKIRLVLIDSLSAGSGSVDENATQGAIPLQFARRLAATLGCTFIFIHHTGKNRAGDDDANASRGSTAIVAAADSILFFKKTGDDNNAKIEVKSNRCRIGTKPKPVQFRVVDGEGLVTSSSASVSRATDAKSAILDLLSNPQKQAGHPGGLEGSRAWAQAS